MPPTPARRFPGIAASGDASSSIWDARDLHEVLHQLARLAEIFSRIANRIESANALAVLVWPSAITTQRQQHLAEPACGTCHNGRFKGIPVYGPP